MEKKVRIGDLFGQVVSFVLTTAVLVGAIVFACVVPSEGFWEHGIYILLAAVLWLANLVRCLRMPWYVRVEEDALVSTTLLGRPLCVVRLDRCVYYACYDHYGRTRWRQYWEPDSVHCIISNELFLGRSQYDKPLREPLEFDSQQVIDLRVDQRSKEILRLEQWVKLGS